MAAPIVQDEIAFIDIQLEDVKLQLHEQEWVFGATENELVNYRFIVTDLEQRRAILIAEETANILQASQNLTRISENGQGPAVSNGTIVGNHTPDASSQLVINLEENETSASITLSDLDHAEYRDEDIEDETEDDSIHTRAGARRLGLPVPVLPIPKITKSTPVRPSHDCVVCMETFPLLEITQLRCKHFYCKTCLVAVFQKATKDESLMPAKCCNFEISGSTVYKVGKVKLLRRSEYESYMRKKLEYATVDRVYCCNINCGSFIPPKYIKDGVATCRNFHRKHGCGVKTCARCKQAAHFNDLDCANKDEATMALENLANEKGWRQCLRCKMMIELRTGCYHMTCNCGYSFCMLCGKVWDIDQPCGCRLMDETRLVENVDLDPAPGPQRPAAPVPAPARVPVPARVQRYIVPPAVVGFNQLQAGRGPVSSRAPPTPTARAAVPVRKSASVKTSRRRKGL